MNIVRALPRDAIPSVDDPLFIADHEGKPDDEVIVVEPADRPSRAYPTRILHHHEIVNDVVDGGLRNHESAGSLPIAVTWYPLRGSSVVYDRRIDGRTLTECRR